MLKREIIAELKKRGIPHDPKALKAELESLLKPVSIFVGGPGGYGIIDGPHGETHQDHKYEWFIPSWCLDERRTSLPSRIPRSRVVRATKPKHPPVLGGAWVLTSLPDWLK